MSNVPHWDPPEHELPGGSDPAHTPDPNLIALSIQQPWAELILRGIKTIEIRRMATQLRGVIYLYTSQRSSRQPYCFVASEEHQISIATLPMGRIVGTVEILDCRPATPADAAKACIPVSALAESYSWVLGKAHYCPEPWKVRYVPYGTWFYPFQRRAAKTRQKKTRQESQHDGV